MKVQVERKKSLFGGVQNHIFINVDETRKSNGLWLPYLGSQGPYTTDLPESSKQKPKSLGSYTRVIPAGMVTDQTNSHKMRQSI